MNGDYAEYRLNHWIKHYANFSFYGESVLKTHYEEDANQKFGPTEALKFDLKYTFPNAPGIAFTRESKPFILWAISKDELDRIFRETYTKLFNDIQEHILLNMREI